MTPRAHGAGREPRGGSAARDAGPAMLLYDAGCALCGSSVRWLEARDRRGAFRPIPLDSAEGVRELRSAGLEPLQVDSVVLIRGGQAWQRSSAAIEALRLLGGPWSLAVALRLVPRGPRDALYRTIARHRHAWFGRAPGRDESAPGAPPG